MNIMDYIPQGRESAVSRQALVDATGLTDRKVRKLIEVARRNGEIIINLGTGYYTTDELPDLRRQYKANQNRAMAVLVQQKYLRRRIKEKETEHGSIIRT